mmetsp:Transcript_5461/g.14495  ORF Transcript_5461/g.14495 Transcript_5461/m.14495 type:complete len:216 (-) Transcript_5461:235-882(-)
MRPWTLVDGSQGLLQLLMLLGVHPVGALQDPLLIHGRAVGGTGPERPQEPSALWLGRLRGLPAPGPLPDALLALQHVLRRSEPGDAHRALRDAPLGEAAERVKGLGGDAARFDPELHVPLADQRLHVQRLGHKHVAARDDDPLSRRSRIAAFGHARPLAERLRLNTALPHRDVIGAERSAKEAHRLWRAGVRQVGSHSVSALAGLCASGGRSGRQ